MSYRDPLEAMRAENESLKSELKNARDALDQVPAPAPAQPAPLAAPAHAGVMHEDRADEPGPVPGHWGQAACVVVVVRQR